MFLRNEFEFVKESLLGTDHPGRATSTVEENVLLSEIWTPPYPGPLVIRSVFGSILFPIPVQFVNVHVLVCPFGSAAFFG